MSSVFLCHASEDKPFVEPIQLALANAGCKVFYDQQNLPPAGDYQAQIRAAICRCNVFVFLASTVSIRPGRFTLTELKFARERWPSPVGRVLAVATAEIRPADLPSYLQAATVLTVSGNAAAEVRAAVEGMLRELRFKYLRRWGIALALGGVVLMATIVAYRQSEQVHLPPQPPNVASTASAPQIAPSATNLNQAQRGPIARAPDLEYRTQQHDGLLKQVLSESAKGNCPQSLMSPLLRVTCLSQMPRMGQVLAAKGSIEKTEFMGMQATQMGPAEVYKVTFSAGTMTWMINTGPDGKIVVLWSPAG
jgi:hypothetical protein